MQLREEIFKTYWKFASERQSIFFRRQAGIVPATSDPILLNNKFCNAYRASDRTSQYLIKHVIYNGSRDTPDIVFRILLFKIFNKIETWQFLESKIGQIEIASFDFDLYDRLLSERIDSAEVIYTAAYMSCATKAFGYDRKHQNHLALIQKMLANKIHLAIVRAKSFKEVYDLLRAYPLIGNFMAYQLATDINYSEVIDFDENSFTMAGPGAIRGINKCFQCRGGLSYEEIIIWMVQCQGYWFKELGIEFKDLWGRELKAIDCQNLFCETDKYCRVAFPELKSNRTTIKARFKPTARAIKFFYPPKWKINVLPMVIN